MNSMEIMHFVILASVLEPIPEKIGCTTRSRDWQDKSRLEYFLISGCNIGIIFYELSERIKNNNYRQPTMIYDLAYKAQQFSFKNRLGGKINFGIIELLIPIIATQVIKNNYDGITVLDQVGDILKFTSKEDVQYHWEFRKIAREVSKEFPSDCSYEVENMYDYYKLYKNELENNVHKEYLTNFKRIKKAYNIIEKNLSNDNLLNSSVIAYNTILKDCQNYCGLAADYICVALYLYLSKFPNTIII